MGLIYSMKAKLLWPLACLCVMGCVTTTHTVTTAPPGPTVAQVRSMVQAHVSDVVIISQIQNSSTRYLLTTDQIIALKKAGVSDAVLTVLINTAGKVPVETITTAVAYPAVYPYVYVDPWPWLWWGWWGWGPYSHGGYYHGYYHGGGYHGGGLHGGTPHGSGH